MVTAMSQTAAAQVQDVVCTAETSSMDALTAVGFRCEIECASKMLSSGDNSRFVCPTCSRKRAEGAEPRERLCRMRMLFSAVVFAVICLPWGRCSELQHVCGTVHNQWRITAKSPFHCSAADGPKWTVLVFLNR